MKLREKVNDNPAVPKERPRNREEETLFTEKVRQLFRNAPFALIATVINAGVLVFVQRNLTPGNSLFIWMTMVLLVSFFRYLHIRKIRREWPADFSDAERACTMFVIGLALSGMAWGSSAFFLFPIQSLAHQTFLIFVIGGMVAGAAAAFSIVPKAFFAYSIPALVPVILRSALLGDEIHIAMSGMVVFFGTLVVFISRQINAFVVTSLKLGLENSALVARLMTEKEISSSLNQELHAEIKEKDHLGNELRNSERQLRHLSAELLRAQEKERKLIAQELHDGIGGNLSAIKHSIESKLDQMATAERLSLEDVLDMLKNTMEENRRIQLNLRPSTLDDLGIIPTISWFSRETQKAYPGVSIETSVGIQDGEIPEELKIVLFRVVQESVSNAIRHGKARIIRIGIENDRGWIRLTVEDNGAGFESAAQKASIAGGMGLESMQQRVDSSGGVFSISSIPGKGTVVKAEWKTI